MTLSVPYIDTQFPAHYVGNFIPGSPLIPPGSIQAFTQPGDTLFVTTDLGFSWIDPNAVGTPAPSALFAEAVANTEYTAASTIISHNVVALRDDGLIEHADKDNIDHFGRVIGIANNSSVSPAEKVKVTQYGKIANNGWVFATDDKLFLGNTGALINTVPTTGFVQRIGLAVDNRTLLVEKHKPVQRS